ncbi:MAG: YicC/YloC family endoribonuclease, partial [Pseudomonadota bacterium]
MKTTSSDPRLRSMTGFAAQSGAYQAHRWAWEMRSVNGKGLDIRLRVPDWIDGLEAALRPLITGHARRGNVTLSLRITREDAAVASSVNMAQASAAIAALREIMEEATAQGLILAQPTAADIAMMRGVMEQNATQDDPAPLRAA